MQSRATKVSVYVNDARGRKRPYECLAFTNGRECDKLIDWVDSNGTEAEMVMKYSADYQNFVYIVFYKL